MEIDFKSDKEFICDVLCGDNNKCFGKLVYKRNSKFSLYLYSFHKLNDDLIDKIDAYCFDEQNNSYFTTLNKCTSYFVKQSTNYFIYEVKFSNAYMSKWKFLDSENDKIDSINLYFNTWNKFNNFYNEKTLKELNETLLKFNLNNFSLSFEANVYNLFLKNDKNILSNFFDVVGLEQEEEKELSLELKNVLLKYQNNLKYINTSNNNCYIKIQPTSNDYNIAEIVYLLQLLISLFSYDFSTSIDKVEVLIKSDNKIIPFYYLDYRRFSEISQFNGIGAFNINSFDSNEWRTIINNLFTKIEVLDNLYINLLENNKNNYFEEFKIIKCVTAMDNIASEKNKKDLKYERLLNDFISDLDQSDQDKILNHISQKLNFIPVRTKKQQSITQSLGCQISELRSVFLHSKKLKNKNSIDLRELYYTYRIFELIIIDYLFEVLGISKQKRLHYKKYCIHKYTHQMK